MKELMATSQLIKTILCSRMPMLLNGQGQRINRIDPIKLFFPTPSCGIEAMGLESDSQVLST